MTNTAQLELNPAEPLAPRRRSSALIGFTFTAAVFLSAALLFVVEPMFGKMVLPLLGGSPAVWTTCMVFFQGALLLGYLYAHLGPRWLGVRWHAVLHIGLLTICLLVLPVQVAEASGALRLENPTLYLLWVLCLSLGAPFVLLSSTGPLLQVWFARSTHPEASSPYFLYAASNAGSLLALLSYPFLIEPSVSLGGQSRLWSVGYLVLIALVAVSAAYQKKQTTPTRLAENQIPLPRIQPSTMVRWVLLAFVPSSFFLALTTYVTTDVASVPLLWIVPLVLYLLSFTIVFGRRTFPWTKLLRWQAIGLIVLAVIDFWGASNSAPWLLPLHLGVFFLTALVCHGELATTRPPASRLTEFYLCLAVGGVLGGVFNAVVAPVVFDSVLEYPLTLLLACAMRPRAAEPTRRPLMWDLTLILSASAVLVLARVGLEERPAVALAIVASGLLAVICLRLSRDPRRFALAIGGVVLAGIVDNSAVEGVLLKERNFFGVREVRKDTEKQMHLLMHGTTKHGAQSTEFARRREPTSYYYRGGPLGDVFTSLAPVPDRKVAIIGLGAGGMTAYAKAGEQWTFYEIDPDIARVARDTHYFTYLEDTPASVDVVLGDGRLAMAEAPSHHFDLVIVDAFSSDAIPVHLLTLEAFSLYLSKLSEKGVLLLHLSNRYLDLEPVVGRLMQPTKLSGLIRVNTGIPQEVTKSGGDPSIWAVLAQDTSSLNRLEQTRRWRPLRVQEGVGLWTDDFSNIFTVFHLPTKARRNTVGAEESERPRTPAN
jgi:spermidine synthase